MKEQLSGAADAPALISELALSKKAPICDRTLSIFVSVFGSEAGNCALKFMGTGGVFVAGIAGKIVTKMQEPIFMESFLDKGRMRSLLEAIPVKIVLNDDSGLIGAARYISSESIPDAVRVLPATHHSVRLAAMCPMPVGVLATQTFSLAKTGLASIPNGDGDHVGEMESRCSPA